MTIYVGSRTTKARKAEGEGITVYEEKGGSWQKFQTLPCLENPSYFCGNRAAAGCTPSMGMGARPLLWQEPRTAR